MLTAIAALLGILSSVASWWFGATHQKQRMARQWEQERKEMLLALQAGDTSKLAEYFSK